MLTVATTACVMPRIALPGAASETAMSAVPAGPGGAVVIERLQPEMEPLSPETES